MSSAWLRDLRYAFRQLGSKPLSNALAVLSLAIAIGAGTVLYSVVSAMLLKPVAGLAQPHRQVELGRPASDGLDTVSYPAFVHIKEHAAAFDSVYAYAITPLNLALPEGTQRTMAQLVSGEYFATFGTVPEKGRLLRAADDRVGAAEPVAVASYAAFERYFGADERQLGRTVRINGQNLTLIGVAPKQFRGHIAGINPDFYLPLSLSPKLGRESQDIFASAQSFWLLMGARLAPGFDLPAANSELNTLAAQLRAGIDENDERMALAAAPLRAIPAAGYTILRWFAALLFLLVLVVLLVACGNVAGLLVARGERRSQEIAMRFVLGARRGAIVRQLLCEAAVLTVLAGALGLLLAHVARDLLVRFSLPTPVPITLDIAFDARVLLFAASMVAVSTLLAGLLPAWRTSARAPQHALAGGMHVIGRRALFRDTVVVAQVGFTLLLLVVAGLFVRALGHARAIDPGFRVENVAVMDFDMEPTGYAQDKQREVLQRTLEEIDARPGIHAVAAARVIPLSFSRLGLGEFLLADREPVSPDANVVAGDFFQVMNIAVRGRTFGAQDHAGAEPVVIINEAAARLLAPQGDALGQQYRFGSADDNRLVRVVGITPDGRYSNLADVDAPFVYLPFAQNTLGGMNLLMHTALAAPSLDALAAKAIGSVDSDLPAMKSYALGDVLTLALLPQRIARDVAASLGAVGLLLAMLGLYGLLSTYVATRTREIGLRLALGAESARIRREVTRRALRLIVIGLVVGLGLALALSQALGALLFGLGADLAAFGFGLLVVFAAAMLATWEPARRAARVNPIVALRHE